MILALETPEISETRLESSGMYVIELLKTHIQSWTIKHLHTHSLNMSIQQLKYSIHPWRGIMITRVHYFSLGAIIHVKPTPEASKRVRTHAPVSLVDGLSRSSGNLDTVLRNSVRGKWKVAFISWILVLGQRRWFALNFRGRFWSLFDFY